MRHLLVISIFLAGCGDCGDAGTKDPWTFGEAEPDADSPTQDATEPAPPDRADMTPPPDLPPVPPCFADRLYLYDDGGRYDERHIVVAGDRVFLGVQYEGRWDLDAVEWTEDGLLGIAETPDLPDSPWAASERWLWVQRDTVLEGRRIDGGAALQRVDTGTATWPRGPYMAQPRRWAAGDRVAWMDGRGTLRIFDGERTEGHDGVQPDSVWLGDAYTAWVAYDGAWHLRTTDAAGTLYETSGDTPAGWPVVVEDAVLYVRGGQVWRYRPGVVDLVETAGVCGPLYSDGEDAVFACDPAATATDYPTHYLGIHATQLWRAGASGAAELLYESSGAAIYGPVVSTDWVVWAEYPDEQADPVFPMGTVKVVQRWATGSAPRDLAQIGQGCQTCGAYWPPPFLDVGRNTVAFSYAWRLEDEPGEPPPEPRLGHVGIVRLLNCD